jgi:glutamate/tyrosine decarboxylase-like PLP-dependent enzyme
MFNLVYETGTDVEQLAREAHGLFLIENALNPMAFPSLLKMENEVVSVTASLSGGTDDTVGNLTSGGTESIFMALKAARDWARDMRPDVKDPEVVVPLTVHPAWNKAAHYLGLRIIMTPVDDNYRADVAAVKSAITPNTIILGGSAVSYPHGVVDPIEELGRLAADNNIWLHVDACLGGWILPFVRQLGYDIPRYGFDVPGVSSISADIHKYAYTPKGVSAVMYRDNGLRQYQIFAYADWPGGVYATPCMAGARPGGTIAAAWAVLQYLGRQGFLELAQKAKRAAKKLIDGITGFSQLYVLGDPPATVFAIGSQSINIFELGIKLKEHGWHIDFQHQPASLHMTVSPIHLSVADRFLDDLRQTLPDVPSIDSENISDTAAMYAMLGSTTDRLMAKDFALQYLNDLYRVK